MLLVGVEDGERVDEGKILSNLVELGLRDEAVLVVVVVLEDGVDHRVHVLLYGLRIGRPRYRLGPHGKHRRGSRRRHWLQLFVMQIISQFNSIRFN